MPPQPTTDPVSIQQDAYTQLKNAVIGSGLTSPETTAYFAPEKNLAASTLANAAGNYNTGVTDANQKAAEKAALEAAAQKQKDLADPSKYQQLPKPDGGYVFLDPTGKEISAFDYSRVTGQDPSKVLSQSQNPIDQGFVNDYTNLQDFMTAIRNNDTTSVDAAIKANPQLENYRQDLPGLIDKFKQHYPTVFGGTQNGNQSVNSSYIPNQKVANAASDALGGSSSIGL